MQHLDPDRLVILALGEDAVDAAESDHLAGCTDCRTEIDAMRHVAELSAETQDLRDLPPPPDRLWQNIAAAVSVPRPGPAAAPLAAVPTPPPVRRPDGTERRGRPRWLAPVLAAAAAAVLAIAGTVTAIRLTDRPPAAAVTARAALAPLPEAPANARGNAQVLDDGRLRLRIQDLPLTTGYYEIWLIDADDTTKMVSLGTLGATPQVELPIPQNADLNRYRLVDVSAEPWDGRSEHSGKSLLRGTLTS